MVPEPDLLAAGAAIETVDQVLTGALAHLRDQGPGAVDVHQAVAYDLAHAAAGRATAAAAVDYGRHGDHEARLACAFVADVVADVASRLFGRHHLWGVDAGALEAAAAVVAAYRDPAFLAELAALEAPRHLEGEFDLVATSFRRFADERIRPLAEGVHRHNGDVPEELITGLAELGAFGLSIPEAFGGFSTGGDHEFLGMVVATEELSRGSLGIGGSLVTRPEILARALLSGGTEEQRTTWLPKLASGEIMAAVAVTEPDYGSDVAGVNTAAVASDGGWRITGVKTWSTFVARAEVLMVLARTDPDRSRAHRGLSLFVVPKPRADSSGFSLSQSAGGKLEGRPIDTIGYRGMHSYELAFDGWWVPEECLVGGTGGIGRGFYHQMAGFENGRLQTAARAVGVMQAAYEAARDYAQNRVVFGHPIAEYQLTRVKLGRMATLIQACRQYSYRVAGLMAQGEGTLEASMIKAYACRAAEWLTREAMQIHGGMGYAEEYPVSRYFLDARVLSIFEGADETLALKVIVRRLLEQAAG